MATSVPEHHHPRHPSFKTSIEKLLNNWQALQLAVENGQGGGQGKAIAEWMRGAVEDFFYQNDDLDGDEVAEFIGTIMNQELDTIVDDNSLEALGDSLVQHFKLAASGKHLELQELFNKLDEEATKPKPKHERQPNEDDSSEDGSGDEEEMEVDASPMNDSTDSNSTPGPSHHRTGRNFVTDPDDDGWVTVTKSKKH